MADRTVYGLNFSENGWRMVDQGSCVWVTVPGADVHLQIREGQPAAIMGAFAADFNAYVEPLRDADSACWTATNSVASSNHLSGTAMDLNWNSHPFRVADAGFDQVKLATVRELLAFYENTIFWGNDWNSPKDAMHFQMGYDTYGSENVGRVQDFINRKIRVDGFSTFRRSGAVTPPPAPNASTAADVLARAAGIPASKAAEILPTMVAGLKQAECTTPRRIAMFIAQTGTESAGFDATEEYASGAEYEGRCRDLGNCSPGDGVKYKGRTWIQVTGKAHYREFSEWAHGHGLVPTATYFVDNPAALSDVKWAGIGAAWYWTESRPMNQLVDAGDGAKWGDYRGFEAVTAAINGGTHGLADRQNRFNRAIALGDQLLVLATDTPDLGDDELSAEDSRKIDLILQEVTKKFPSRSPLRHLGEGVVDTMAGFILNADGSEHVEICRLLAGYGHPPTLALLREVAGADPVKYPDRQEDAKLAQAILAEATTTAVAPSKAPEVATVAAVPQIVYVDRPATTEPSVTNIAVTNSPESPTTPGQLIGAAYDALAALPPDLSPIEKASLTAVIGVIQAKTEGAPA